MSGGGRGGGGRKNRKPSRVKRNMLKPTAAWAEWTRVSLTTERGKGSESMVRGDNILFPIIQATVPLIHSPGGKRSKIKPLSLVKRNWPCESVKVLLQGEAGGSRLQHRNINEAFCLSRYSIHHAAKQMHLWPQVVVACEAGTATDITYSQFVMIRQASQ